MHKNYHFVDYFALLTCHLFSSLNLKHSDGTGLININLLVYIMQNYSNTENVRIRNGSDNWGVSKNVLFQTLFIDFNIWFLLSHNHHLHTKLSYFQTLANIISVSNENAIKHFVQNFFELFVWLCAHSQFANINQINIHVFLNVYRL